MSSRSIVSANINAKANPGTTPALCAIFAKSSGNWRNVIRKAFIPEDIVGDTPEKEALRVAHIKKAVPGVTENTVVRFSILDRRAGTYRLDALEVLSCENAFRPDHTWFYTLQRKPARC